MLAAQLGQFGLPGVASYSSGRLKGISVTVARLILIQLVKVQILYPLFESSALRRAFFMQCSATTFNSMRQLAAGRSRN
jgi:hypothetical protein